MKDPVWRKNVWRETTGASKYVITKDGESHTIAEWAEIIGIAAPVLLNRWARGWPDEEILKPTRNQYIKMYAAPDPQFDITKPPKERED